MTNPTPTGVSDSLDVNRKLTNWFIAQDPTIVTLVPRQRVQVAGGGYEMQNLPARAPQTVKFNQSGSAFDGIVDSGDGVIRQYEFIMIGPWDMEIAAGDWWEDASGNFWEVSGFVPFNGYETKAGIHAYGTYPANG